MTPALLKRTWSLLSLERNSEADFLIVVRSLRSRCRNWSEPLELGVVFLISWMAGFALSLDRAAT